MKPRLTTLLAVAALCAAALTATAADDAAAWDKVNGK